MRHHSKAVAVLAACFLAAGAVYAQEKKEEEPFWAKGKPKDGPGAKMAPVAAPPIPVAADKLPKLKVPAGFKVEVYQSGILDARGLRRGDKGTIFVSSLFVAGKIYAITEKSGKRELKTILSDLELPSVAPEVVVEKSVHPQAPAVEPAALVRRNQPAIEIHFAHEPAALVVEDVTIHKRQIVVEEIPAVLIAQRGE